MAVSKGSAGEKKADKATEDVSKNLSHIKGILYGVGDQEPQTELVAQLSQEMYNNNMLFLLIQNLHKVDFEGRKDVVQIFNNMLRRQIGARAPTVEHICVKQEILTELMNGYNSFLAHLAKGHVSFCHHLASVVVRRKLSHLNLLL